MNVNKVLFRACRFCAQILRQTFFLRQDFWSKWMITKCCFLLAGSVPRFFARLSGPSGVNKVLFLACRFCAQILRQAFWSKWVLTKCCFWLAGSGPRFYKRVLRKCCFLLAGSGPRFFARLSGPSVFNKVLLLACRFCVQILCQAFWPKRC